ncbi:uncharacterized protein LOC128556598 [Mercenaria mercenaria]|uniref:uncharacterized protein LOC128556598 n=1 Tax=Mercenaria mercenaria TaxID=6596 RepID=UPI00234F696E|nr:uncharacterized protein LOC128556598 [Mercenaria mercenaria]
MINSNLRSSPLPKDDTYISCNETEQESLHEDNRSSKKDSGFSTMHDESLTIDTPVYGDIPEVLTSENLDSFNKSLAEQSTFINVSVNCSDSKTEEKTEKVEKWLHDVSVEMEKESETSIDRKVNRISQEMCRNVENQRSSNKIRNGRQKHEVNRQRQNSVEIPKGNVLFFNTVVSKSCQPLQRQQRSDMNVDCQRGRPVNLNAHSEEIFGHGDRHILKVHRSLTPQFHQRLKDEQVAELMRKCGRNDDSDAFKEVTKRKHSEFCGKRYIDQFDDELENKIDILPTPPKSRKLNGNASGPFKQRYEENEYNYFIGDKKYKSSGHRKVENVDNYIEKDYRKTYPADDRQEMLAYMMQRNFPKKSSNSGAEYKHGRNTDREDSLVNDEREVFPNRKGTKKDSQHNEYQNIYHEIEYISDQDAYANFDSNTNRQQKKMKSPKNGNSSIMSPRQRDERNLRMKNACISPVNQYGVNQSYIRKLKNSPKFEDAEDGLQSQHYDELGETSEEIHERNSNLDKNQYEFERSPRIKGRHTSRQANKRTEYNQCNRENDFDLNEGETVFEKSEQSRTDCNIGFGQYSRSKAFSRQYRQIKERDRPEIGHYDEVERVDIYNRHENCEQFVESSPKIKNRSRKSNVRTDQDMYTNPRNYDQDEFYDRNANYKGAYEPSIELSFEKERYSSKKMEDFNNSNRNFVDNDEEFEDENDYVSPRTQIKRYHLECHLGSPHWHRSKHLTDYRMEERSPHQQRNNVAYKDSMSPTIQRTSYTPLETEYKSPCTRRNANKKCEDFSSPIVQRAKASSRQDEFSPSTSLAKMRLNTPKSRSEDRRRQHRRSQSRGEDCETNVDPYQKPCYQSEVCDANAAGKDNINDYSFDKEFSRKIQGQEKEMPVGTPTQSSQRFVSLDQIGGMPLQFRIQQLESGHSITGERRLSDRRKEFRNVECSNQYICEQSNENSEYYENEQIVHPSLEINRNSNVYHKYYEVVNERGQERGQSPDKQDSEINSNEHNTERPGNRLPTTSSEPKMRKSLFSPTYENRRQNTLSQSRKTVLQSGKGFDAFKIPMSPPVVARTKVNKHNKENEHDEKKMFTQKTKCASSEVTKTREGFSNKRYTNSGSDKMTPLQYMQSTPIKPGIQFTMNTTMSTIMGSDETEINNDANEEIVLI